VPPMIKTRNAIGRLAARRARGLYTLRTACGRGLPLRPREELVERGQRDWPHLVRWYSTFGGTCAAHVVEFSGGGNFHTHTSCFSEYRDHLWCHRGRDRRARRPAVPVNRHCRENTTKSQERTIK
jgi:hypothetical protein